VYVRDPLATSQEALHHYGFPLTSWDDLPQAEALVAAVAHRHYLQMPFPDLARPLRKGGVFCDVKCAYDPTVVRAAGFELWRL
jgi:UDP-N-acetyl-D-galactosamine dehydrogenase